MPCSAMFTEHHRRIGEGEDAQEGQKVVVLLEEERILNRGGMFAAVDMTTTSPGDRHHSADWQGWEQGPGNGLRLTMRTSRT